MNAKKRTPPEAPDEAQRCVGERPSCGPHVHKYTHPRRENKPKLRPKCATSLPARSRYRPGSDYRPPEKALARRQGEVLELRKECGSRGVTKLEAPRHLSHSLSQRICELRQKGYRIDSELERADEGGFSRYVLVATEQVPKAGATR